MRSYNPEETPSPPEWLDFDEDERLNLVLDYHTGKRVQLPNARLHASFHVIIENQIAQGEEMVIDTLSRLEDEGLSRHEAIHAIASVLSTHMYNLWHEGASGPGSDPNDAYFEGLQVLSAELWRRGS